MALTECAECGGKVSTSADSCPHCGFVTNKQAALQTSDVQNDGGQQAERVLYEGTGHVPYVTFVVDGLLILAFGLGLILLPYHYFQYRSRVYRVTTKKIEFKSGLLSKSVEILPLYRIRDLKLNTTFGRGEITLYSSDETTPKLKLAIPGAEQVFREIQPKIEQARQSANIRLSERV